MCEPGDVRDFTLTEGGEEFDALVDRICAEAEADAKADAKVDANADEHGLHGLPDSELSPHTPPGTDPCPIGPTGNARARVPPRLAILIQHALVGHTRAKPLIAKCVRGLRF